MNDSTYGSELLTSIHSEDELARIQADYRQQKMKENLIGPVISTFLHIILLVICATFFVGTPLQKNESVEITPTVEDAPQEEPPPPPPPPEVPPPEPTEVIPHDPNVTSVETPDAADLIGAIDDVSDEPPSTEDNAETDLVNDIKPSASNLLSSKMFGGRSSAGRRGALATYGGSSSAQLALDKSLNWLAKVQNPDGSWGSKKPYPSYPSALTGLALMVFLARGETPKSKRYGKTVSTAITWLINDPIKKEPYSHAIKTYSLCEAYAMTGNYALKDTIVTMVEVIIKGQQEIGGFHYSYNRDSSLKQDLSVGSWNYQALKAAHTANIPAEGLDKAISKSIQYLKGLAGNSNKGDGFPYDVVQTPTMNHYTTRAGGVLALQLLGEGKCAEIQDELDKIYKTDITKLNWKEAPKHSLYGWYYATQCMFQAGGKKWKSWNNKFQPLLKNNQNPVGYWEWPSETYGPTRGSLPSKIYATALCSLMLTVYYRYLPSTIKKGGILNNAQTKKVRIDAGDEEIDIF